MIVSQHILRYKETLPEIYELKEILITTISFILEEMIVSFSQSYEIPFLIFTG